MQPGTLNLIQQPNVWRIRARNSCYSRWASQKRAKFRPNLPELNNSSLLVMAEKTPFLHCAKWIFNWQACVLVFQVYLRYGPHHANAAVVNDMEDFAYEITNLHWSIGFCIILNAHTTVSHLTKKTDKVVGSHKKYIITIKWKVLL